MLRFRDSNALNPIKKLRQAAFVAALLFVGAASPATRTSNDAIVSPVDAEGLQSSDLYALKSVDDVQLSPKGQRIAYTVICNDRPGRPYSRVFVRDLTNVTLIRRLGRDAEGASNPRWSPDGKRIAFLGRQGRKAGLMIANGDGTGINFVATVANTNTPIPYRGESISWSPDGRRIAFVSATPEVQADANGDPRIIERYRYKPYSSGGASPFSDNRRLHIFVVTLASREVKQLTEGPQNQHSIDWSPRGDEIAYVADQSDDERVFGYDLFAIRVADGRVRRLTDTKNSEYYPEWSPDGRTLAYLGTRRPFTSFDSTMEDTHVWLMDSDGSNRRDIGGRIDNRQGAPKWSQDGRAVFTAVQQRGNVALYKIDFRGDRSRMIVGDPGIVASWSVGSTGLIAYAFRGPRNPAELFVRKANVYRTDAVVQKLTSLNEPLLANKALAVVETFTFKSFDGRDVEAVLTIPTARTGFEPGKHPLIVSIHGGPHSQSGVAFTKNAQVYAAQGWATLSVNYRGSVGYGQQYADASYGDQNGGDAKDVLAGVDAALVRYPWLDRERLGIEGGSYGGQLTNWIITRSDRFSAAIPIAGISNLVSFNYMSYYHDYLAAEFGAPVQEDGVLDRLWERSPLRYARNATTPTLFVHGENDNDVPIAEAEQFYIALKDAGVETTLLRYPREGHELRETAHVVDRFDRSIAWYARHFDAPRQASYSRHPDAAQT